MEEKRTGITVEELDPAFLFTWKGTRHKDKTEAV